MANLLHADDPRVRVLIRRALEMAGGFGRPLEKLLDDVNFLHTGKTDHRAIEQEQLERCIEWSLSRQFVRAVRDDDTDTDFWVLTPIGRAKQNESLT